TRPARTLSRSRLFSSITGICGWLMCAGDPGSESIGNVRGTATTQPHYSASGGGAQGTRAKGPSQHRPICQAALRFVEAIVPAPGQGRAYGRDVSDRLAELLSPLRVSAC